MKPINPGKAGLIYHTATLRRSLVMILVLLSCYFCLAENATEPDPHPSPTDAVKLSSQKIEVLGRAPLEQGSSAARYAALLDGYATLLKRGADNSLFPGAWSDSKDGFRVFRINGHHPGSEVLSWVFRSRVKEQSVEEDELTLSIESAPLGSLASARPELRAMVNQDVDQDGLSDVVGLGYDGSIQVIKSSHDGAERVLVSSPSYALLEVISGPGYERVRAVVPQDIGSVVVVKENEALVLLELEYLEMVNGRLMGRGLEYREVKLHLDGHGERIRFEINEPPDFSRLVHEEVELRGVTISEKALASVVVHHNGKVAWESPEGIGIRALNFNLERRLSAGWNSFRVIARDTDGVEAVREVWVEGPADSSVTRSTQKRAIILTLDDRFNKKRLLESLEKAGFDADQVEFLQSQRVTGDRFLSSIAKGGADELLLYCEAHSSPGSLLGGKTLQFADGSILPREISQSLDKGGYERVLGLIYSELPRDERNRSEPWELWRDTTAFLSQLGQTGRLFVSNIEAVDENPRRSRARSRERLQNALNAEGGCDLCGLLDREYPTETLFRGWMLGTGVMKP